MKQETIDKALKFLLEELPKIDKSKLNEIIHCGVSGRHELISAALRIKRDLDHYGKKCIVTRPEHVYEGLRLTIIGKYFEGRYGAEYIVSMKGTEFYSKFKADVINAEYIRIEGEPEVDTEKQSTLA